MAFKEVSYTNSNSKQKHLVRYILRKLSEHDKCKYSVDFDELTIEHLCPQAKIGTDSWTEEVVGSLGNLILLDQVMNGKLETKDFHQKKTILTQNGYVLRDFIQQTDNWTPDQVSSHTEELAITSFKVIWKI